MSAKYRWFVLWFVVALGLDQGTKIWARQVLKPIYPQMKTVIAGFFEMRYSENPGSAFGAFRNMPGSRYFLFIVGVAALVYVAVMLVRAAPSAGRLGGELGLLAGGAFGNIIDRITIGRVTDFIVWRAGSYEWPTFNIADAALVIGVALLAFDMKNHEAVSTKPAKK